MEIFLGLGSNLGNREQYLDRAKSELSKKIKNIRSSKIYETEPWGKTDQPKFLNICLAGETELNPQELLKFTKSIETKLGRKPSEKWGPREIDIDILFCDALIINKPGLKVPHPHLHKRAFVLKPLNELAPDFIHPILKKPIKELTNKTKIMGILNATPDSFSDGGDVDTGAKLQTRVKQIINEGADIIDIGGESTRPGHKKVSAEEEISRVLPAIKAVKKLSADIPVSIDTQKAEVAKTALKAGANIINDVSALGDLTMAKVVAEAKCQIILMRNRPLVGNIVSSCREQFEEIIKNAESNGIKPTQIMLDPGLGFGDLASGDYKSLPGGDPKANLALIKSISEYSLGFPVVIGASRKRFIGELTGVKDPKDRVDGSVEMAVLAANHGATIVRVHDIASTIKALEPGGSK